MPRNISSEGRCEQGRKRQQSASFQDRTSHDLGINVRLELGAIRQTEKELNGAQRIHLGCLDACRVATTPIPRTTGIRLVEPEDNFAPSLARSARTRLDVWGT